MVIRYSGNSISLLSFDEQIIISLVRGLHVQTNMNSVRILNGRYDIYNVVFDGEDSMEHIYIKLSLLVAIRLSFH